MQADAFSGFYKKSHLERLDILARECALTPAETALLEKFGALDFATANRMVENVVGTFGLPLGIATNFRVNNEELVVPMALEEPSVIAGASLAAKLARPGGGFVAETTPAEMIGQIQLVRVKDAAKAVTEIKAHEAGLLEKANAVDSMLIRFGGGARRLETAVHETPRGTMLIVHLVVDVRDAMGANAINSMCERVSPELEALTGGEARLKIISNLAIYRIARAKAVWKKEALAESFGENALPAGEIVERILDAFDFAAHDVFRATTHNKGIMNGIDAVAIATGQDFRALEAGAHAYAFYKNQAYRPLTRYRKNALGDVEGEIELPLAVGIVGGATKTHPLAGIGLKLVKAASAQKLAMVMASVGLAQNFAAMRALSTEGIQKGHMRLHARNIAVIGGATGEAIEKVAEQMIAEKNISATRAKEIVDGPRARATP